MRTKLDKIGLCFALFCVGCASSSSSKKTGDVDAGTPAVIGGPGMNMGSGGVNGGMAGGAAANPGGGNMTSGEARQYLSFVRRRTVPDNMEQPVIADIIVYDFKDGVEINITGGTGEVDCISRLCVVTPELTWVAWLDPDRNQLKVAPIDLAADRVLTDQTRVVEENVDRVEFMTYKPEGGDAIELLVYTQASAGAREVIVEPAAGYDEASCAAADRIVERPLVLSTNLVHSV